MTWAGCSGEVEPGAGRISSTAGSADLAVVEGQVLFPSSLVSNNSASLVSNNSASFRTLALREIPVEKARIDLLASDGTTVASTLSNGSGHYAFSGLERNRNFLVVATFSTEGRTYREAAIVGTGRSRSLAPITAATTLVSFRFLGGAAGYQALDRLVPDRIGSLVDAVADALTEIPSESLERPEEAGRAFDRLAADHPDLSTKLTQIADVLPSLAPSGVSPEPTRSPSPTPSPSPGPSQAGSPPPSPGTDSSPSPAPSQSATPAPSPSPTLEGSFTEA